MTITRRSLFASLGLALPVALTALGAEAATAPATAPHHAKKHHGHTTNANTHAPHHHSKTHHTTAGLKHPQPQA